MLEFFIPLWGCFFDSGISEYFVTVTIGFFIATVPVLIRYFLRFE